jgi:hypothetical protein
MTTHHHVPSEDEVLTLDRLIECAHDTECGCAERGVELHPAPHPLPHEHVDVVIEESTVHLIDGFSEYGD